METKIVVIELMKLAVQVFFSLARTAQMSEDEAEALFHEEREKLLARDPADLPEV